MSATTGTGQGSMTKSGVLLPRWLTGSTGLTADLAMSSANGRFLSNSACTSGGVYRVNRYDAFMTFELTIDQPRHDLVAL